MARAKHGKLTDPFVESMKPHPDGGERIVRDGVLPGFLIRVGKRKKSFELRIEKPPRVNKHLGTYPTMGCDEARVKAQGIWDRHKHGEPIEGPVGDAVCLDSVWPQYVERLKTRHRSSQTIDFYGYAFNRLSADVRYRPLRELGAKPEIMVREIGRIETKHGATAALATARCVRAVYRHIQRRVDPSVTGNPISGVEMEAPERNLPVLKASAFPKWWKQVQELPHPITREALLFGLLSGLRRNDLASLQWENVDIANRAIRIIKPKGGKKVAFDLVLSRPMLRCLWRAKKAGALLYPEQAARFVFPAGDTATGHIRGDSLTKQGVLANHALRRSYATFGRAAGVPKDSIRRLLNHAGGDMTDHYIRDSGLGRLYATEQETVSAALVRALGAPRGLA